ncbi:MAG: hypothetical protein CXZ00_16170 [Acidobacteria bacterium]|nr:MAG: hypothetical protein CXZ00_16170 [Acidobacteriota bacterium]
MLASGSSCGGVFETRSSYHRAVLQRFDIFSIQDFPECVAGVILFFAGAELALTAREIGKKKADFYVMLIVAGFAMWNMGVAFVVGVVLDKALRSDWIAV